MRTILKKNICNAYANNSMSTLQISFSYDTFSHSFQMSSTGCDILFIFLKLWLLFFFHFPKLLHQIYYFLFLEFSIRYSSPLFFQMYYSNSSFLLPFLNFSINYATFSTVLNFPLSDIFLFFFSSLFPRPDFSNTLLSYLSKNLH